MNSSQRHPSNHVERGVALLMAIVVLAALLMIGTPFVLSMRLQEEGAAQVVAEKRARLAAESARNRAVNRLFSTHPGRENAAELLVRDVGSNEEGDATEIVQHPANIDEPKELEVPIPRSIDLIATVDIPEDGSDPADELLGERYSLREGDGRVVAVEIEDEQGKLNLNTVPPIVLGNLLGGSQLSERVPLDHTVTEIPVIDTSVFYADNDPDTVDGVVVIMNPLVFHMEAISYRGKTDTHLTGCFRGEYLSFPQDHAKGWPIFDIRAFKVFLHRYYDLDEGQLYSYRTPQGIREIAEWSIVPYFLKENALLGLNSKSMGDFGLTPEMLVRANLDEELLKVPEEPYDEREYKDAKRALRRLGVSKEMLEIGEKFRGPTAIIQAAKIIEEFDLGKALEGAGALGRMLGADPIANAQKQIKGELDRIKKGSKGYFERAINAYEEIMDRPGSETFTAHDFLEIEELVTTSSTLPAQWSDEQMIIGEISHNPIVGFMSFQVPDYSRFNAGTLIRIRSRNDPNKVEYHIAMGAIPAGRGPGARLRNAVIQGGVVAKASKPKFEYEEREALVSTLQRHPVNVNTAPRRILEAVMSGISVVDLSQRVRYLIDSKEAKAMADLIIKNRPLYGFEDLRRLVEEAREKELLNDQVDEQILLLNAQNPNDPFLSVSSVGFCYATGDVYTIESSAIVNSPVGLEQASHRMRELIEVAPPDTLTIVLDGQDDWMYEQFKRRSGVRGRWPRDTTTIPGREGNYMITGPTPLNDRNWEVPSVGEGQVRALTTELPDIPGRTFGNIEHFAFEIEGSAHSVSKETTKSGSSSGGDSPGGSPGTGSAGSGGNPGSGGSGSGAQPQVVDLLRRPGAVEFWMRFEAEPAGTFTIFDCASTVGAPDRNRIRLYYETAGRTLVYQVMDDAAAGPEIPRRAEPHAAGELRHVFQFRPDTWYYIHAVWKSASPGEQALFIDGRVVGNNVWVGELAATLQAASENVVSVKDANIEWFPKQGALMVGTEVIEYDGIDGNAFDIRRRNGVSVPSGRGRRGSIPQNHAAGTPVRLFGYRVGVTSMDYDRYRAFIPTDPNKVPITTLAQGKNDILVGRAVAKLEYDQVPAQAAFLGGQLVIPYTYPMAEATLPLTAAAMKIPLQTGPGGLHPINDLGFEKEGYAQLVFTDVGSSGFRRRYEYIRYHGVQPSGDPTAPWELLCVRGVRAYEGIDDPDEVLIYGDPAAQGSINSPAWNTQSVRVYGVSVKAEVTVTPKGLEKYYANSGVFEVQGIPSQSNTDPFEFIRYSHINRDGRYFLADVRRQGLFRGFSGALSFVDLSGDGNDPSQNQIGQVSGQNLRAGETIVPVIAVDRPYVGAGEHVSVATSNVNAPPQAEQQLLEVHHAGTWRDATFFSFYPGHQPEHVYKVFDLPEVRKFPSGGLPTESSTEMQFGRSAAATTANGTLNATFDEIRLSQPEDEGVDLLALPLQGGRVILDDAAQSRDRPTLQATQKVIRTSFRGTDEADQGLDRILLIGKPRVVADEHDNPQTGEKEYSHRFDYVNRDPARFGFGATDGLFFHGGEVFHYQNFDRAASDTVTVLLAQDLARDPIPDPNDPLQLDERDYYRTLVLPQLQIVPRGGTLPARDGFLQFMNSPRGEIIYYEYRTGNTLRNVLRGQLGTEVGEYTRAVTNFNGQQENYNYLLRLLPTKVVDLSTRSMLYSQRPDVSTFTPGSVMALGHIPVTHTTGGFTNFELPVADVTAFPNHDGYVIFDDGNPNNEDEIFAIAGRSTDSSSFRLFRDEATGKGIFRGRFGTPIRETVPAHLPVVIFNARYHDHYQPQVETPDLGYIQRSFRQPGARWESITWQVVEQRNRTFNNEVRVVARLDGKPEWDAEPTNQPGGLYMFTNPNGENYIGVDADEIEIRVYYRYLPGSYGRNADSFGGGWNDEWKHSPVMDTLSIEYRKEWRILKREELPF